LRNRGNPREALLLSQDLVEPVYPSYGTPLTDEQCELSEEGVNLIKAGLAIKARHLLESNNLRWVRNY
jgi:hypothetical protein